MNKIELSTNFTEKKLALLENKLKTKPDKMTNGTIKNMLSDSELGDTYVNFYEFNLADFEEAEQTLLI